MYIFLFSIALYWQTIIYSKQLFKAFWNGWPFNPVFRSWWIVWIGFLAIFSPYFYQDGDMQVWVEATKAILTDQSFPETYVYMPIYAQFLAAVAWPFYTLLGFSSELFFSFIIHGVVVLGYLVAIWAMVKLLPQHKHTAPCAIAFAPVTIWYIFCGINHVVMLALFLIALINFRDQRWWASGFWAMLSGYKFMLIPTIGLLTLIVGTRAGTKGILKFIHGASIAFIPNILYYIYVPEKIEQLFESKASLGAHAWHIESFNGLYYLLNFLPSNFEFWYLDQQIWFYIVMIGTILAFILFRNKRLNILQSLAFSYAFVAIFSPEPMRLEPFVGLLWIDSVFRKDQFLQLMIVILLFTHAATWLQTLSLGLSKYSYDGLNLFWNAKALILSLVILLIYVVLLWKKTSQDELLDLHKSPKHA